MSRAELSLQQRRKLRWIHWCCATHRINFVCFRSEYNIDTNFWQGGNILVQRTGVLVEILGWCELGRIDKNRRDRQITHGHNKIGGPKPGKQQIQVEKSNPYRPMKWKNSFTIYGKKLLYPLIFFILLASNLKATSYYSIEKELKREYSELYLLLEIYEVDGHCDVQAEQMFLRYHVSRFDFKTLILFFEFQIFLWDT